jgi:hypothetical protein
LAAEATIIRQDEKKASGETRQSLHLHRVIDVRREARASLLAYAFLRGKPLFPIEHKRSRPVRWADVRRIAKRFGGESYDQAALDAWAGLGESVRKVAATMVA